MKHIEDYIIAGTVKQLSKHLGIKIYVSLRSDLSDVMKNLTKVKQGAVGFLRPQQLSTNTQGFRANRTSQGRHHGASTLNPRGNPQTGQLVGMIPTIFEFSFSFFPNDIGDLLQMYRKWGFTGLNNRADFTLEYLKAEYFIRLELENDIAVPEKANMYSETPEGVEFEAILRVEGFISGTEEHDVYELPVINSIEFEKTNLEMRNIHD